MAINDFASISRAKFAIKSYSVEVSELYFNHLIGQFKRFFKIKIRFHTFFSPCPKFLIIYLSI